MWVDRVGQLFCWEFGNDIQPSIIKTSVPQIVWISNWDQGSYTRAFEGLSARVPTSSRFYFLHVPLQQLDSKIWKTKYVTVRLEPENPEPHRKWYETFNISAINTPTATNTTSWPINTRKARSRWWYSREPRICIPPRQRTLHWHETARTWGVTIN